MGSEMCIRDRSLVAIAEEQRILAEEISKLPERFRAPLLLFHIDGKKRTEVAQILGLHLGAVKARLETGEKAASSTRVEGRPIQLIRCFDYSFTG